MKLILFTRKVDSKDSRVGFFTHWVNQFGLRVDRCTVITWQKSSSDGITPNIEIISLSGTVFSKILQLQLLLWKKRREFDAILFHMNPEYVIIGASLARVLGKRTAFWYTHKAITIRRRIAECLSQIIFTASKLSFRKPISKKKLRIVGHGIPIEFFYPNMGMAEKRNCITVGRVTPTKDLETMILAVHKLRKKSLVIHLTIVGEPALKEDNAYFSVLKELIQSLNIEKQIRFLGPAEYENLPALYRQAYIYINLSKTGSLDKSMLEATASGCVPITSNEAFKDFVDKKLFIEPDNIEALTKALEYVISLSNAERRAMQESLRHKVEEVHSLSKLVPTIISLLC